MDEIWENTLTEKLDFNFDASEAGVKTDIREKTPMEVFSLLWDENLFKIILEKSNRYGEELYIQNRPKSRCERFKTFRPIELSEMRKFFGICMLSGQLKFPSIRTFFSKDPLYFHPVVGGAMSGRRFEQILRCLNCTSSDSNDPLHKVRPILTKVVENSQNIFYPNEELSLDESLLLFRGRLKFRVYLKNKKTRYGIKFYELCSSDGFVLKIEIYTGAEDATDQPKIHALVFRLLESYLNKGHHLYMDNFYNSYELSKSLLECRTHTTGTLRSNRKGNPKEVTQAKLAKGQHVWRRKNNIYVSKWKDKRDVLAITTAYEPKLIEISNRYGQKKTKPLAIARYNDNMSGIDRADQMISYYSCPRKTIRWYKKVIFHLFDIAIWNAFYLYKNYVKKVEFVEFRDLIIRSLLDLPADLKDGRNLAAFYSAPKTKPRRNALGHVLQAIPVPENSKKSKHYRRCRQCSHNQRRKETAWQCSSCIGNPPLCVGTCFEEWHL